MMSDYSKGPNQIEWMKEHTLKSKFKTYLLFRPSGIALCIVAYTKYKLVLSWIKVFLYDCVSHVMIVCQFQLTSTQRDAELKLLKCIPTGT